MSNRDSEDRPVPVGRLFVLSAPSGSGKATVEERALRGPLSGVDRLELSVSHTTRRPRAGEREGVDYYFVDDSEFERMVEEGAFLEWARYQGCRYGTSRSEVEERRAGGIDVLLEIEMQGASQVLGAYPEACAILILPPSFEELRRRLEGRGSESAGAIAGRLRVSVDEIRLYELYHYAIINDDADRAALELAAVVLEKRLRLDSMRPRVREVLKEFEEALERE